MCKKYDFMTATPSETKQFKIKMYVIFTLLGLSAVVSLGVFGYGLHWLVENFNHWS